MARTLDNHMGIEGAESVAQRGPTVDMAKVDGVYQMAEEAGAKSKGKIGLGTYVATGLLLLTLGAAAMGCAKNSPMMQQVGTIVPGASNMWYRNTATGKISNVNDDPVLKEAYASCRSAAENYAFWQKRGSDRIFIHHRTNLCLDVRKGYIPVPRK